MRGEGQNTSATLDLVPELMNITATVTQSPPSGGTEYAFVSFCDDNIREIVELQVLRGKSKYPNNNCHTETRNLHTDFGFLFKTVYIAGSAVRLSGGHECAVEPVVED